MMEIIGVARLHLSRCVILTPGGGARGGHAGRLTVIASPALVQLIVTVLNPFPFQKETTGLVARAKPNKSVTITPAPLLPKEVAGLSTVVAAWTQQQEK